MDPESFVLVKRIIIDLICLCAVALPILIFKLFGVPYQRGFFCNDESIRYPFKESTITNVTLYIVGMLLPVCTILLIEIGRYLKDRTREAPMTLFGTAIPVWVVNSYKCIGIFGFGAASSQTVTDIGKYTIGRLRPHFIDICQPLVNCTLPENMVRYITDFKCQGTNQKLLRDSRLSFPSGHSSFAAYSMIFVILYLQCRLNWKGSYLLKHLLQMVCLVMAWGTALSRVSNYKHHWSDVLAGLIIGTVVALLTLPFIWNTFKRNGRKTYIEANNGASVHQMADHHT